MKYIKQVTHFLSFLALLLSVYQCAPTKEFRNNIPFKIDSIYSQSRGSNTNLYVKISSSSNIILDSVYFQNKGQKLNLIKEQQYVANFQNKNKLLRDLNLDGNRTKEYGNTISKKDNKTPFNLSENSCIISYKTNNIIEYHLIENVENKPRITKPTTAPRNQ